LKRCARGVRSRHDTARRSGVGSSVGQRQHLESRAHVGGVVARDELASLTLEVADTRTSCGGDDVCEALALGLRIAKTEAVLDARRISAVVGVNCAVGARANFVGLAIRATEVGSFGSTTRARGSAGADSIRRGLRGSAISKGRDCFTSAFAERAGARTSDTKPRQRSRSSGRHGTVAVKRGNDYLHVLGGIAREIPL